MLLPMFLRKWKQRKLKKSLLKQIQVRACMAMHGPPRACGA